MKAIFRIITLLLLSFTSISLQAQTDKRFLKDGDDLYLLGKKNDALAVYLRGIEKYPESAELNFKAGKLYIETEYKTRSLKYFEKAFAKRASVDQKILYYLGEAYHLNSRFDEAIDKFTKYKKTLTIKDPFIENVDRKIYECNNGKEFSSTPIDATVENAGALINSPFEDFGPVISAHEDVLIFTSTREGSIGGLKDSSNAFYEDIYISHLKDGVWEAPKNMGATINTDGHDAAIAMSADGLEFFSYTDNNNGDINYYRIKDDTSWSKPFPVEGDVNSNDMESSLCVSADRTVVFFTSNRPGGMGGLDIYKSAWDGKKKQWGKAENLGEPINTSHNEESPFFDLDGKTLYFSSRGHKGMGYYDLFKSVYDSATSKWSEPENMGYPINTPDDDIFFVLSGDGKHGYYASIREEGLGLTDIYKITMPARKDSADLIKRLASIRDKTIYKDVVDSLSVEEKTLLGLDNYKPTISGGDSSVAPIRKPIPGKNNSKLYAIAETDTTLLKSGMHPTYLQGTIFSQSDGTPIAEATVTLLNSNGLIVSEMTTGEDGVYHFESSNKKETKYTISARKDGYHYDSKKIKVPANTLEKEIFVNNLKIQKLVVGAKIILRNIYYDFNSSTIKPESFPELAKLVELLKENPGMEIEIGGHTDIVGTNAYNKSLSQRRAESVVRYLIRKGIGKNRLRARGYGEDVPLATNDDEREGRELNRRTEFEILKQ